MRITVDIDDFSLESVMKLTGEKKKSSAVHRAVQDYIRRAGCRKLGNLLKEGALDDAFDWEAIEKQKKLEQG
jgi:Arc/MetJ family transcription regulator